MMSGGETEVFAGDHCIEHSALIAEMKSEIEVLRVANGLLRRIVTYFVMSGHQMPDADCDEGR